MKSPLTALERRTLGFKLILGFSAVLLILLLLGMYGAYNQRKLTDDFQQFYEEELLGVSDIKEARIELAKMSSALRQAIIAPDAAGAARALEQLADAENGVRREIQQARLHVFLDENKQSLAKFEEHFAQYRGKVEQTRALYQKHKGRSGEALAFVSTPEFQRVRVAADEALEAVVRVKEKNAREAVLQAQRNLERNTWLTSLILVGGIGLGLLSGLLITLSIRRPAVHLRDAVEQLAAGKLEVPLPHTDYPNETGDLARAITVLQSEARQLAAQRWIKMHQAEIQADLQTATGFTDLAQTFLSKIAPLLGVGHGVIYLFQEEQQRLSLLGAYAYRERKNLDRHFSLGQGLVGQCALERQPIILTQPPADYIRIGSSLGEAPPRAIAVLPVLRKERLLAVVELATFAPFGASEQALLDGLLPILAMSLEIIERSQKAQELLAETRRQADNMERQAARLEEQTVELEAQQASLKETTDSLAMLEERSRLILGSVNDGIVGLDNNGVMTFANPAASTMLGYTAEEFVGKTMHSLVHHHYPDGRDFPREECSMYCTTKDGQPRTADNEVLWRKDGAPVPVEYSTTPVFKDDALVGTVVVYRDITKRKMAEGEIKHINFLNDQALGLTKAGYWHVPLDGSGWYNSSQRAVAIFGDIPNDRYRYRVMEDWFVNVEAGDPEYAKTTGQNFQDAIDGKVPAYDSIYAYKRPVDGRRVWIHAFGTVAKDKDGKATDMYGVTQDITEYMHAQQDLAQAKEVAEEATRAKSEFLANMSHEIRTPMNAIIGMSHLALQTRLDKKQKNYIEKVNRAAENLLGIINDILDFSKIEAGRLSMEKIDFHLEDVMDNLANLVGMKAEDKGLELLFNIAPNIPTALVGDPLRLGQVLINLGNNSVKFTDKGEIIVGAEVVAQTESGVDMHFWVHDSGIGLTPDQCGKMFQSFIQADASTTRKYGGTGLGLAISKKLVEMMDGRIWVESEYGKSSTFHFHAKFGVQKQPAVRRVFKADELLGLRVLVVDDNESAREILSNMAKSFGLEVDAARDGRQALDMVAAAWKKELPYDLVLMDWRMPVMDGVECVRRLQEEYGKRVPAVIMVTAFGRDEAMGDAEEHGVALTSVLSKPVTSQSLLEAIGEALGTGYTAEPRAHDRIDHNTGETAQLRGTRVLLVEDNEMNQELAAELLGQAGIEVVIAGNGRIALDMLAKDDRFDGVLMDCQMPVMDGYTATREIRKNPAWKNLPVVAMTANAMAGDREKVIEAGMNDHIAKPLDVARMFATLAHWIRPVRSGAEVPVLSSASPAPVLEKPERTAEMDLPGIDRKAGLAATAGNARLYGRMLEKFRDSQADFAARFAAARADAVDPNAATRAAHTLKGTAGNIGARGVQAAATELEHACNGGAPAERIHELLAKTLVELDPVIAGLAGIGGGETSPHAVKIAADPARLGTGLDRLKALLSDSNTEAGDLVEELTELAKGTSLAAGLNKVARAIADYDFDRALAELTTLDSAPAATGQAMSDVPVVAAGICKPE